MDTSGLNAFVRHLYCSILTHCTGIVARVIIDVGMRAKVFTLETLHAVNTEHTSMYTCIVKIIIIANARYMLKHMRLNALLAIHRI